MLSQWAHHVPAGNVVLIGPRLFANATWSTNIGARQARKVHTVVERSEQPRWIGSWEYNGDGFFGHEMGFQRPALIAEDIRPLF
jgi:hypothetical protein